MTTIIHSLDEVITSNHCLIIPASGSSAWCMQNLSLMIDHQVDCSCGKTWFCLKMLILMGILSLFHHYMSAMGWSNTARKTCECKLGHMTCRFLCTTQMVSMTAFVSTLRSPHICFQDTSFYYSPIRVPHLLIFTTFQFETSFIVQEVCVTKVKLHLPTAKQHTFQYMPVQIDSTSSI